MDREGPLKTASTLSILLFLIGLGLLGWGLYKGPFAMQNPMIAWGLTSVGASFSWHYLSHSRNSLFDGRRTLHLWHRQNLILGLAFLVVTISWALRAILVS
jgi:hypothetical protein